MFGYVDEFTDNILKENNQFKIVWNGDLIWITNYIKIIEYNKERIILKVKNNSLIVEGIEICIKMLSKKELIINGKFKSINIEKPFVVQGDKI